MDIVERMFWLAGFFAGMYIVYGILYIWLGRKRL